METAVCIVTNNNYYETRFCIENLISKTKQKFRLHIIDNASSDIELLLYLEDLVKKEKGHLKRNESIDSLAKCYNYLLQTVYQDVCVFVPINSIVNTNWLEDLLNNIEIVDKCGIVCIRPLGLDIKFIPKVHKSKVSEDYLNQVIDLSEKINTLVGFKKEIVEEVGVFDENLNCAGFEFSEFAFRTKLNGYNNFSIRKQSLFQPIIENEILFPKSNPKVVKDYKQALNTMYKVRLFKK